MRKMAVAVGILTATAATLWAALMPRRTATLAYVAVAGNNHVRVIDLATGETLRKIYSGATPWRLLVSPDTKRLWVQHWFSGTTAVVDLEDHEIVHVLPFRGPGRFSADGEQLLTFDWPGSALAVVDAESFATVRESVTEVSKVYDLAPDPDGATLHLVQYDPMARGPRERYAYLVSYPWREEDAARARPVSLRTGLSPAAVQVLHTGPFLITADRETNGLTLLNKLGDGRAVPTCPAPQAVFLAPDETRMAVVCWRGDGARQSQLVLYHTDFSTRPWPTVTQTGTATMDGALVAGAFSPRGDRLFVVDRAGGLLLEADPETLELRRKIPVGDVPVDLAIVEVPQRSRDRVAGESRARRTLKDLLTRMRGQGAPVTDLSWIETITPREAGPAPRRQRVAFQPPDRLRVEDEQGGLRLSAGGDAVSVEPDGRFRVAPRQELLSLLWGLSAVPVEEAVRLLAGDVPGSPWLRGGLAVDLVTEVRDKGGARSVLIGASRSGERVSQLWVDAETGRVTDVVEQFPIFQVRGHQAAEFDGLLETKLYDMRDVAPGVSMPARLERVVGGRVIQDVRIEGVAANRQLPDAMFDLARLGGIFPRPAPLDPPTSGEGLPWLADWGIHRLPVPPELQVHNLEHGGVALQYNCPESCPDLEAKLEEIARTRDLVLVAPYPLMKPGLVLTAWGQSERLDTFDEAKILAFLDAWAGKHRHDAGGETGLEMARAH
ncbi:MAG TPA: DUF3105 domain-containing protein [Thermoanaerobaculia bacterium]|nr:DUF3105 domain-containing protein [Thermoanaerobaculia bacterium]